MFSSRFMLFPTLKKKWCKKKFGGGVIEKKKKLYIYIEEFFSSKFHIFFTFHAISNIKKKKLV